MSSRTRAGGRFSFAALLALALLASPIRVAAEDFRLQSGQWSPHAGIGFTADPDAFLMVLGVEYGAVDFMSVGPLLQLGFSDDDTIVAPTADFRFGIDLSGVGNQYVRRLEPFVHAGLGLAYIEKERGNDDHDDVGFLMNGGVGANYWFADEMAVGTQMTFNGMPDDVLDEHFFFSWQIVTFRFRF